jgi:hypothetical protein
MSIAMMVDNNDWRTAQMLKKSIEYYKEQDDRSKYLAAIRKETELYREVLDTLLVKED